MLQCILKFSSIVHFPGGKSIFSSIAHFPGGESMCFFYCSLPRWEIHRFALKSSFPKGNKLCVSSKNTHFPGGTIQVFHLRVHFPGGKSMSVLVFTCLLRRSIKSTSMKVNQRSKWYHQVYSL